MWQDFFASRNWYTSRVIRISRTYALSNRQTTTESCSINGVIVVKGIFTATMPRSQAKVKGKFDFSAGQKLAAGQAQLICSQEGRNARENGLIVLASPAFASSTERCSFCPAPPSHFH
uniref:Elongation factor P n=1 Tax=Mesocestoides corti TaxID=53468 RepID=A0A5K3ESA8_MESCO